MIKSQKIALIITIASTVLAYSLFSMSKTSFGHSDEIPASVYQLYSKWSLKYGNLRMAPNEDNFRLIQFNKNYQVVQRLRETQPTAEFGLNFFATITDEEFNNNYNNPEDLRENEEEEIQEAQNSILPQSLKAVSPGDLTISNIIPTIVDQLKKLTKSDKKQSDKKSEKEQKKKDKKDQRKTDSKETDVDYKKQAKMSNSQLAKKYYVPNQRKVMDQGKCGSCYAFSTKHNLEDVLYGSAEISAQHIMQCSREDNKKDKNGCNGGSTTTSLEQMLKVGYKLDADLPYTKEEGECIRKGNLKFPNNLEYLTQFLKTNNEIKRAVLKYKRGISMGIKTSPAFKFYTGGIFDSTNSENECTKRTGHAVHLSGWGEDYWRVKNSWGQPYGIKGYVHVKMNDDLIGEQAICICGKKGSMKLGEGCKFKTVIENS